MMEYIAKIVSVDDNRLNLLLIESMLESMNVAITSFTDPLTALKFIRENPADIILTDYMMPVMDGVSFIKHVREIDADIPVVMVTAVDDDDNVKIAALQAGAYDFLYKPLKLYEFQVRIKNLLSMRRNQLLLKDRAALLQDEVLTATKQIEQREFESLSIIGRASEYKDMETGNHIKRVAHYCRELARDLGLDQDYINTLFYSSPLHDIGKIGIPDSILLKPARLTDSEFVIMQQHTVIGHGILNEADGKYLKMGAEIAISHHERWDGSGYPKKLSGEDIPISGRIVAISDVFDALMSKRPYKDKWTTGETIVYIQKNSGKMFDPALVASFDRLHDVFMDILKSYDDSGE